MRWTECLLLQFPDSQRQSTQELFSHVPQDVKQVRSGFFGDGAFEFYLATRGYNVLACDHNAQLVHFWHTMRTQRERVIKKIMKAFPVSRESLVQMQEKLRNNSYSSRVREAAAYYVVHKCTRDEKIIASRIDRFNRQHKLHLIILGKFWWPARLTLVHADFRSILQPTCSREPMCIYLNPSLKCQSFVQRWALTTPRKFIIVLPSFSTGKPQKVVTHVSQCRFSKTPCLAKRRVAKNKKRYHSLTRQDIKHYHNM